MKKQDILSIKNLFFSFGNKLILNDVNLTVPKGSFCAIIGDNGAGKTTTIKSILGIFKAKYDSILVNNMNVVDALKNNIIGYVPEKENFSKTSVIDWLVFMASLSNISKEKCLSTSEKYLNMFGISGLKKSKMSNLSSGQKKMIMIIQSLLNDKNELLIMDEPTENLDPKIRQLFYQIVSEHIADGKTFVISTHNLDEIKKHVSYVIFIKQGQVKYQSQVKKGTDLYKIYNSL